MMFRYLHSGGILRAASRYFYSEHAFKVYPRDMRGPKAPKVYPRVFESTHIYIYIYTHIPKTIAKTVCWVGGWGCESDQEIILISILRACERSCMWPRDDIVSVAGLWKLAARAVPYPSLRRVLNHVNSN